jgi:cytochrome c biogenesis protein CcdA
MLSGGSYALGALAGALSTLSPCVLPLLPILLGGAAAAHRWGPLALAAGVGLSFVAIGLFVATIGFAIGLDGDVFRAIAAAVMAIFGIVLLSGALQRRLAFAGAPLAAAADRLTLRLAPAGAGGQFLLGLLLGAVWSPCVGPTLGAAATLAAQRSDLPRVALVMLLFGLGAALPLLLIGSLSREAALRWRGRMAAAGQGGKIALGLVMLIVGVAILAGADRELEAVLVRISPQWLTNLTTQF